MPMFVIFELCEHYAVNYANIFPIWCVWGIWWSN